MNFKLLIRLAMMFIVPFVVLAIVLPKYFNLPLEGNTLGIVALSAFVMFGFILLYSKKGHQSQMLQYVGLPLLIISFLFFFSSIGISGSEQMIELGARVQAYFLIGMGIGIGLTILGIKKSQRSSKSMF